MDTILNFIKMVYQGKTLRRIVFNWKLKEWGKDFSGTVVDFGAGSSDSLKKWLPEGVTYIPTDINKKEGVLFVDLNKPLPFADDSVDAATLFFSLYIFEDAVQTLKEIRRVLKPNGKLYLATPLIAPEIPEPHDYSRLTYEGLERKFTEVGFSKIHIERSGERVSSAVILLHPLFIFNTIRLFVFSLALVADRVIRKYVTKYYTPHTYFCILQK
jgi:SAM-dependent methyltransferase